MKYHLAPHIPADIYVTLLQVCQRTAIQYTRAPSVPADIYVTPLQVFQWTGMKYNCAPSMPADIYVALLQACQQTAIQYTRAPSMPADIYIPPAADRMNVYSPFKWPYLSSSPMMQFWWKLCDYSWHFLPHPHHL